MDLSKAYDCMPHELLIATLKCYGLENGSLRLLLVYLLQVCNFADDNTLYRCNQNLEHVFSNFKYDLRNVLD